MGTTEETGSAPDGKFDPLAAQRADAERELADTDEFLMRLVTLCASLSGAAIFLLTDASLGMLFRFALISLLVGLLCALKGRLMVPNEGGAEGRAAQMGELVRRKKRCVEFTAAALILGLCLAAGGVWLR